jgi:hypothetical protein
MVQRLRIVQDSRRRRVSQDVPLERTSCKREVTVDELLSRRTNGLLTVTQRAFSAPILLPEHPQTGRNELKSEASTGNMELLAAAYVSHEIRGLPVMAVSYPKGRWFKSSPRNHGKAPKITTVLGASCLWEVWHAPSKMLEDTPEENPPT